MWGPSLALGRHVVTIHSLRPHRVLGRHVVTIHRALDVVGVYTYLYCNICTTIEGRGGLGERGG